MMAKKTVKFNEKGTDKLPNDKPVVYKIQTASAATNYVSIEKKGRVRERIKEHLGEYPGVKVQIEQMPTIKEDRKKEKRIITRTKPKYNKQGKWIVWGVKLLFESKHKAVLIYEINKGCVENDTAKISWTK